MFLSFWSFFSFSSQDSHGVGSWECGINNRNWLLYSKYNKFKMSYNLQGKLFLISYIQSDTIRGSDWSSIQSGADNHAHMRSLWSWPSKTQVGTFTMFLKLKWPQNREFDISTSKYNKMPARQELFAFRQTKETISKKERNANHWHG